MKLLYAFPEPLPLPKARGIQVAWMVHALCTNGFDVTLAHVPSADGHPLLPLGERNPPKNLKTLGLPRHWPFPFSRWHSVARFTQLLLRWIDQSTTNVPDVVFVRHIKLAYRLLRARPDLRLIYEAHECFVETAAPSHRRTIARQEAFVLTHAAGVVFISKAVQAALEQHYIIAGEQIVLHSGVDIPETLPRKDWGNCGRHIVYAGSFFGWKGVADLIAAAANLPGCQITIVGGTPEEIAQMQSCVSPEGAKISLRPRIPADQVTALLQQACIAVLPNRADGVSQFTSPLKLFEYMGAGCAIVASRLPSVQEVLPNDCVTWCEPGNPDSIASALNRLVREPELAQAQGEKLRRLSENFSWQSRAAAVQKFAHLVAFGVDANPERTWNASR